MLDVKIKNKKTKLSVSDTWYLGKFGNFGGQGGEPSSEPEYEEQHEERQGTQRNRGGKGLCLKNLKGEGVHNFCRTLTQQQGLQCTVKEVLRWNHNDNECIYKWENHLR